MMQRAIRLLMLFGWLPAIAARADEAADDLKMLQGTWEVVSAQEAGMEQTGVDVPKLIIIIKEDTFSFKVEGQEKTLDTKLKLDPSASPKAVDLFSTLRQARSVMGIYVTNGNDLKICWARRPKPRPDTFETKPGDERIFLTLKRVRSEGQPSD